MTKAARGPSGGLGTSWMSGEPAINDHLPLSSPGLGPPAEPAHRNPPLRCSDPRPPSGAQRFPRFYPRANRRARVRPLDTYPQPPTGSD
jgi:hypothetical protein